MSHQVPTTSNQVQMSFPDKDRGYNCPCCGQLVKRYYRKLNSNMALTLLLLYRSGLKGYVHIENFMQQRGHKRSGDFPYLVHWRFLEKMPGERQDGSSRTGFYKITGLGIMFAEGKLYAREKIMISNNRFEGFDGGDISIQTALTNKFNYDELMKEPV